MYKFSLCLILSFLLTACSTVKYEKPDELPIDNVKFVNKPIEEVWDTVVGELFTDFFIVDDINKTTYEIKATFLTEQRPSNVINCGLVSRTYKKDGEEIEYKYDPADATAYIHDEKGITYYTEIKTKLTSSLFIKVAKSGEGATVNVDVDYALNRTIISKNKKGEQLEKTEEEIKFTTQQPYITPTLTCTTNGAIENIILNAIK